MSNGDLLRAAALGEAHLWVGTKGFFPIAGETGEDCSVVQQCLATQLAQAWQTLWLHLPRYRHGPAYGLPTGTGSSRAAEGIRLQRIRPTSTPSAGALLTVLPPLASPLSHP